jgi:hypothetical protein
MQIYRVTNQVNGKVYIGKTVQPMRKYWRDQLSAAIRGLVGKRYLYNAIRKHGPDAFAVEVIHRARTPEELSAMETFFIVLHQSHRPENGYNLAMGGEGFSPGGLNPRAGNRALKGTAHPMFGRHHSENSNRRNRDAHLGIKASLETRALLSLKRKGGKSSLETRKRVAASKLVKRFPKLSEALRGKPKSEQARRSMSAAAKLRAQRPECLEILRANGRKTASRHQVRGA